MARTTIQLPMDVAAQLKTKRDVSGYVVEALREKLWRDQEERFRASAKRIAASDPSERDVEFALPAQAAVIDSCTRD